MHALARATTFITVILIATLYAMARPATQQQKAGNPTGVITGQVTVSGKPALNIAVMLVPSNGYWGSGRAIAKTTTDREGQFQLTRIPAGRYYIAAFAPAYFSEGDSQFFRGGKSVMLSDGESIEGINISLKRGGVITGRVTDAGGRPLVEQYITLSNVDQQGRTQSFDPNNYRMMQTDDRGVYRIYGIPPGRYLVSVGVPLDKGYLRMGQGNIYYPITYHPNVTDESKATAIEVKPGGEATGVDIVAGRVEKAYAIRGRVVDADTGKPVPNQVCGYGSLHPSGNQLAGATSGPLSDDKGEFRIESIVPGKYAAFATVEEGSELYADLTPFEITDKDVGGIEVKVHRGASIAGSVVIEGLSEQEAASKLSEISLQATVPNELRMFRFSGSKVNPDGSFRITGIQPGKARIALFYSNPKGISIVRVERDGLEQREGIEVAAGESVSGVKVFLVYGTGVIRGQVKVEGVALPEFMQIMLTSRPTEGGPPRQLFALADVRGRFVFEGLAPGEYEVRVNGAPFRSPDNMQVRAKQEKQTVVVTNGAESEVTIVLEKVARDN